MDHCAAEILSQAGSLHILWNLMSERERPTLDTESHGFYNLADSIERKLQ